MLELARRTVARGASDREECRQRERRRPENRREAAEPNRSTRPPVRSALAMRGVLAAVRCSGRANRFARAAGVGPCESVAANRPRTSTFPSSTSPPQRIFPARGDTKKSQRSADGRQFCDNATRHASERPIPRKPGRFRGYLSTTGNDRHVRTVVGRRRAYGTPIDWRPEVWRRTDRSAPARCTRRTHPVRRATRIALRQARVRIGDAIRVGRPAAVLGRIVRRTVERHTAARPNSRTARRPSSPSSTRPPACKPVPLCRRRSVRQSNLFGRLYGPPESDLTSPPGFFRDFAQVKKDPPLQRAGRRNKAEWEICGRSGRPCIPGRLRPLRTRASLKLLRSCTWEQPLHATFGLKFRRQFQCVSPAKCDSGPGGRASLPPAVTIRPLLPPGPKSRRAPRPKKHPPPRNRPRLNRPPSRLANPTRPPTSPLSRRTERLSRRTPTARSSASIWPPATATMPP